MENYKEYISISFILDILVERYSYIELKTILEILDIIYEWRIKNGE